jgi:outer membrane receptor for ferrienterochelin and colicins
VTGQRSARCTDRDGLIYYRNSAVQQRIVGADLEVTRELRAGVMASAHYGFSYGRYASNPNDDPDLSSSRELPNAPAHSVAGKVIFPIAGSINGAVRAAFEDRRRIDVSIDGKSERAVVADAVLSGRANRFGVNYSIGLYNVFNWRYALPGQPYASNLIPQAGRSLMVNVGIAR